MDNHIRFYSHITCNEYTIVILEHINLTPASSHSVLELHVVYITSDWMMQKYQVNTARHSLPFWPRNFYAVIQINFPQILFQTSGTSHEQCVHVTPPLIINF